MSVMGKMLCLHPREYRCYGVGIKFDPPPAMQTETEFCAAPGCHARIIYEGPPRVQLPKR